MVEDLPSVPPAFPDEAAADDDPKRRKKEAKLLAEATRALDPWERYRTLVDTLEEAMDLVELADRKARFALVIMGALNISFFFLVTRAELIDVLPPQLRPFLGFYLLLYAGVALFFFLEAIEALKPRRFRPHLPYPGDAGPEHFPEGLRYYEDIVLRDLEAYRRAWREVRFSQLNAEIAVQNHVMARINSDKFRSLRRLYGGLRVLTLLAGGLLAVLALSMLASRQPRPVAGTTEILVPPASASLVPDASASAGLAAPVPVVTEGLREASGIVWHRRARALLRGGRPRHAWPRSSRAAASAELHRVKGNLEDLAVHTPTGLLVLLAEKKGELVIWDPATSSETARFPLDVAAIVGKESSDRNQGFEGLAFREDAEQPGGGIFYLVHQRKPARLVALAFDPAGPARTIGASDVVSRHGLKPFEDLTAVTWSEPLGRLLVIAESDDRLLLVSPAGTITGSWTLPGGRQEGLAFDPEGALWVADEREGLFKIPGALAALTGGRRGRSMRSRALLGLLLLPLAGVGGGAGEAARDSPWRRRLRSRPRDGSSSRSRSRTRPPGSSSG